MIQSIQKSNQVYKAPTLKASKPVAMEPITVQAAPQGLKNAKINTKTEKSEEPASEKQKLEKHSDEAKAKSVQSLSRGISREMHQGLHDAKVSLKHDKASVKLHEEMKAQVKRNDEVQTKSQSTQNKSESKSSGNLVEGKKNGDLKTYTSKAEYHGTSQSESTSNSKSTSDNTIRSGAGVQKTHTRSENHSSAENKVEQNRTVTSEVAIGAYSKQGAAIKEVHTSTKDNQNISRDSSANSSTDTEKQVTQSQKGKPTTESYSHQKVDTSVQSHSDQNIFTEGESNSTEKVKSETLRKGDLQLKETDIKRHSDSTSSTSSDLTVHTDASTTITNLNKGGDVLSSREINRASDVSEQKDIETEAYRDSHRNITQVTDGKHSLSKDVEKISAGLTQNTETTHTSSTTILDEKGRPLPSGNTVTKSQAFLEQQEKLEIERKISKGPKDTEISGSANGKTETHISTHSITTTPSGQSTERQIDRNITQETNSRYEGELREKNEKGMQSFNLSNIEVSKQRTEDVTREGEKSAQTNSEVRTAKELNANISFTPQENQVRQVAQEGKAASSNPSSQVEKLDAPKATVSVNFGSYSGMAGGFKFDSGEVSFNLSFKSAQLTEQESVKTDAKGAVSSTSHQTGQANDASLSGKLTSSVNEAGERVIEFKASYNRSGEKYVVDQTGERKNVAVGEQDTEAEITGKFVISKNGEMKKVTSEFEMSKSQTGDARGTNEDIAKKALAQNDPLRNIFSYDGNGVKANLGFASFNFSINA